MAHALTAASAEAFFKKMGEICEKAGLSLDALVGKGQAPDEAGYGIIIGPIQSR